MAGYHWMQLRAPLQQFVLEQEAEMKDNDEVKGPTGWLREIDIQKAPRYLEKKLFFKMQELTEARQGWDKDEMKRAAVHIANYAMMIHHYVNYQEQMREAECQCNKAKTPVR